MKIVVISLKNSLRRRDSIRRQFAAASVPFEFFDAVDGASAHAHVHHFDGREFFLNTGRAATANEIACYASHLAVWRDCADAEEPFVILEDDARLGLSFVEALQAVETSIDRFGFVRLSNPASRSFLRVDSAGGFDVRYCRTVPLMALGYAIAPRAARRMADAAAIVEEPIDKFVQRFWRHKQAVFALHPSVVFQHPVGDVSDVGTRLKPPTSIANWAQRSRRKAGNALCRFRFNATFILASTYSGLRTRTEVARLAGPRTG